TCCRLKLLGVNEHSDRLRHYWFRYLLEPQRRWIMRSAALNKHSLFNLLAASSVAYLVGCIPVTGTYYEPYASSGEVVSYSGSGCGPKDTLRLNRLDVIIWITYLGVHDVSQESSPGIRLDLKIPK